MTQKWMIDVLLDLSQCARENNYSALGEVLDDAIFIAAAEFRQRRAASGTGGADDAQAGNRTGDIEGHSLP
ncbi:hypothetical protein FDP22_03535 [Paroceanicella profunda]|uniref:Uncharacterized protein n=1 Tax=Paroceanicella profunda TaxID=2579971 RepID=A0A5B8FWR3_9RHOB|nr:hypothetical protein [Paroceanicella profunda]QDL90939.1 hypothetical protein FDP22_03535 [Paroceanicella profunda]